MVMRHALLAALAMFLLPNSAIGQSKVDPFDFIEEWDLIGQDFRRGKLEVTPEGIPAGYDTEMSKASDDGYFYVSIGPEADRVLLNEIHTWLVEVKTKDGEPVSKADISFFGGMPLHGHGFPTAPRIGDEVRPGVYTLDGLKFSMGGWWAIGIGIVAADQRDRVDFHVILDP